MKTVYKSLYVSINKRKLIYISYKKQHHIFCANTYILEQLFQTATGILTEGRKINGDAIKIKIAKNRQGRSNEYEETEESEIAAGARLQ